MPIVIGVAWVARGPTLHEPQHVRLKACECLCFLFERRLQSRRRL
jgi:hypothetical protein